MIKIVKDKKEALVEVFDHCLLRGEFGGFFSMCCMKKMKGKNVSTRNIFIFK